MVYIKSCKIIIALSKKDRVVICEHGLFLNLESLDIKFFELSIESEIIDWKGR
jgi:hypothetical protein